jgi:hypothetical protein
MKYVDIQGFKNGKPLYLHWKRIPITDVRGWVDENPETELFNTVQQFRSDVSKTQEEHHCPFYLDIDNNVLEKSLDDSRKFVDYILSSFGDIPIRVWFSGSKGFHILLPQELLGAVDGSKLTYHWQYLAGYFAKELKITTIDKGSYTLPRLWRIENTPNYKSIKKEGDPLLYKIPLSLYELGHLTIVDISDLARKPREFIDEEDDIQVVPALSLLYGQSKEVFERSKQVVLGETRPIELDKELPPCISYVFQNGGILRLGYRNRTSMVLAGYCKSSDTPLPEAQVFIEEWLKTIPEISPFTSTNGYDQRWLDSLLVLKTVYNNEKYHFSCGSIKECGFPEELCRTCKSIVEEAEPIDLDQYAKADNIGKYIVVEADVIGRDKKELLIPRKITGSCHFDPDKNACTTCSMQDYFVPAKSRNERTMVFNSKMKSILDLTDPSAGHTHQVIMRIFDVESKHCPLFKYDIEWMNAQTIHISRVINHGYIKEVRDNQFDATCLLLEHGVMLNRGYRLYGRVYQNPRSRAATLVVDKAEPLQAMLDTFTISAEEKNKLDIFKAEHNTVESIMDKVNDIHCSFRDSFVYVFGRDELIMAMDMVFHSARWLNFQRQKLKGWLDVLVIGDSGQAKTLVAERLMGYYKLGTLVGGETSSRTGLLYTIQIIGKEQAWVKFGILPRSSGYLVVVDEVGGMTGDDFKEFTRVRSSGEVDVNKAGAGVAKCEVRLISIANAVAGKSLASYGYPVMALPEIPAFSDLADIRRFDYVIGVRAGDVLDDDINKDVTMIPNINNPYTPELCRNLILWLWQLSPDKIIISHDTEVRCLELAKAMSEQYIPDIPLVEAGDVRQKIIRLAVAFAGRTFNSPDGETLVITPEHANCAYEMINMLFKKEGLDYWGYSDDKAKLKLGETQIEYLLKSITDQFNMWDQLFRYLLSQNLINKLIMQQTFNLAKDAMDRFFNMFVNHQMIEPVRGGMWRKTPLGRKFLRDSLTNKDIKDSVAPKDVKEKVKEDDF